MKNISESLLSILVIPFRLPNSLKFEYSGEIEVDDPKIARLMEKNSYLDNNFLVSEYNSWTVGSLDSLDSDGTPAQPFIQKMFAEMPRKLTEIVRSDRWWIKTDKYMALIRGNDYSSIGLVIKEPIAAAMEIFIPDESDLLSYLIIHIESDTSKTSLETINLLKNLHNTPLKKFLDELVELGPGSKADPFLGIQGLIPKDIRSGVLITQREAKDDSFEINDGVLEISVTPDRKNKARFKTKYSFLGMLVSIQRDRIGEIRTNWPVFNIEESDNLIQARIKLGTFINQWWWPRIFADDKLSTHYTALQDAFGLQAQLDSYRSEINDLSSLSAALDARKTTSNSSRLNLIVLIAAIFGVIPGWVAIFFNEYQVIASLVSASVFALAFGIWKFFKLLN
jgi:hypothetical protein